MCPHMRTLFLVGQKSAISKITHSLLFIIACKGSRVEWTRIDLVAGHVIFDLNFFGHLFVNVQLCP